MTPEEIKRDRIKGVPKVATEYGLSKSEAYRLVREGVIPGGYVGAHFVGSRAAIGQALHRHSLGELPRREPTPEPVKRRRGRPRKVVSA